MTSRNLSRRTALRGVGAGLVAALGVGTATGVETDAAGSEGGDGATVPVRVAHLVPDGRTVDVYVNGRRALSRLEYGEVSPYVPLPTGEHTVRVVVAGDSDEVVAENTDTLSAGGGPQTVVAVGQRTDDSLETHTVSDARSGHDPSTAKVRVVHASPDAPSVTVSAGDATLAEGLGFGEAGEYVTVPAGDHSVSVAPAGGGDPVTSFEASLDGCSVYTVFATGYLDAANAPEGTDAPFGVVTALGDSGLRPDFATALSGANEVPPVDTDAAGSAVFERRGDEMRFEVAATGLENVTAGHVHAGAPGENGPVVVPLFAFASGVDGPESEARTVEGTLANASFTAADFTGPLAGADMDELVSMMQNGEAYVNVHTVASPSGELRGDL